ncbi:hypothetical protein [Streptomyces clavuligerus]|uniref:Secreted protein n=1 Tax=Streptomyces clavuligerus TaxID=1901 RepID=E2Q2G0_STRCL|nr:hypothetical protein [Streptomyces clavuligerus]ANW18595.1 hypothetical protein BB341_10305 [Streptomyces clavuligerus]AXU13156.1 hypothetical protein D1794_10650 [Streptomyces clavuligerus]EFG08748.1 Hypothetical protein SCLAV_3676 [Streptomyces clavuligerus]MBY6303099.1 hypothetical protein [Streptomyces clavuligerus]QCS05939.1 hypothetical protein CRV15_10080 [Streptomyces clavuligerus]
MRSAARTAARAATAVIGAGALALGLATTASAATAGRTVTDGGTTYTLSVTAPGTAAASGANITVSGSGFNQSQGIYVGLCAIPAGVDTNNPATWNSKPTPCLGGQDQNGTTGASHWINNDWYWMSPNNSSPYTATAGGRGSFSVTIHVKAKISTAVSCGQNGVRCAVVTRADHFDANDRAYDVYVPVTFS